MTEITKAPSKEAMEAVRGVRCPHEPVNCDYCVAAALEAFAAPWVKAAADQQKLGMSWMDKAKNGEADRDALRKRNRKLVAALTVIRDGFPNNAHSTHFRLGLRVRLSLEPSRQYRPSRLRQHRAPKGSRGDRQCLSPRPSSPP